MKIILVAGARPNFMKIAPVIGAIQQHNCSRKSGGVKIDYLLMHTGQHYDDAMSKTFFDDLNLPEPDIYLGVGSGSHAEQTGKVMMAFEQVCLQHSPNLVVVVGDVNSTLACAVTAAKLRIPVAHIEAGLRSYDRSMPEEINRILTDQVSDYLFTTCEDANDNLRKEGVSADKIHFVGNVMIDTLLKFRDCALERIQVRMQGRYALVTLHRPSNVDYQDVLQDIFEALTEVSQKLPVIFAVHPRTQKQIEDFGVGKSFLVSDWDFIHKKSLSRTVYLLPPLPYLEFLHLLMHAECVLTDSGGIQEETTILNVPCLTLRENTERPITVTEGTNFVVGNNPEKIVASVERILESGIPPKKPAPRFWDGEAAERIIEVLSRISV